MSDQSTTDLEVSDVAVDEDSVEDLNEAREVIPYNFEITSYGADYDVEGLVRRLDRHDIQVPTFDPEIEDSEEGIVAFQRGFVWKKPQSDRFVESLLLGLPVPGIFLVRQQNGVLLVMDGQQRLRTLQSFYKGVLNGKEYRLDAVQDRFKSQTYGSLDDEDRRRLDNAIIHATVVRQEQPSEDQESVYLIFERLNTGGTNLQAQEIRAALYSGPLARLLRELNDEADWRTIFGKRSDRLKDHELILRFFALRFFENAYERPMKVFLNRYMATNRNLERQDAETLTAAFRAPIMLVRRAIGDRAFRLGTALNAAVYDAVMVGVSRRLVAGQVEDLEQLRGAYDRLVSDEQFLGAVTRATADDESVRLRLRLATEQFADLP